MVANGQLATLRRERQDMTGRNATAALGDGARAWPLSPAFQARSGYYEGQEAGIGSSQIQQQPTSTEDTAQNQESVRDLTHYLKRTGELSTAMGPGVVKPKESRINLAPLPRGDRKLEDEDEESCLM